MADEKRATQDLGDLPGLIAQADEETMPGATAQAKVERVLALLGGLNTVVRPGDTVLLKPNFVAPFPQAATDLGMVAAVAEAVRAVGGRPVVAESAGFEFDTAGTFRLLGVSEWAKEAGVPLLNLDEEPYAKVPAGMKLYGALEISRCALEADAVLNLPKLKRHSFTRVTLGIKNLMGFLNRDSRRLLHAFGLERGLAALARIVQPELTILDALTVTARAVYGETEPLGIVAAGRDVVAMDYYGCHLLGEDPQRIAHIREAERHGLGTSEYQVIGGRELERSGFPGLADLGSLKEWLYRLFFRAMYVADLPYARVFPKRSLIPAIHYWLGLRPHLEKRLCNRCGVCVEVCPMDAVDVQAQKVVAARCMHLRCLRCVSACPQQAIYLRGWRR